MLVNWYSKFQPLEWHAAVMLDVSTLFQKLRELFFCLTDWTMVKVRNQYKSNRVHALSVPTCLALLWGGLPRCRSEGA